MHRLTEERGAVAVIVALLLTAIIGMGALVVDLGAVYEERRELQNGADAAALAVAADCAAALPTCAISLVTGTADNLADLNAADAASAVTSVDLDLVAGLVTVDVATLGDGGADSITFGLARILGFSEKQVTASATATWGTPSSLTTLPLTISVCQWNQYTLGGTVYAEEPFVGAPRVITFHNPDNNNGQNNSGNTSCTGSAGQHLPGGFGWLPATSGCSTTTEVGEWTPSSPGNSPSCPDAQYFRDLVDDGTIVALPVFSEHSGNGSNGQFLIDGFLALRLTGYRLNGGAGEWVYNAPPSVCSPSTNCLIGHLTDYVTSGGAVGGSTNYGTTVVQLTA